MKRQRVTFIKVKKTETLMGIGQGGSGGYIYEGMQVKPENGGGKIGPMFFGNGVVKIQKVDEAGNPVRNFGSSNMSINGAKMVEKIADHVNVPVDMLSGFLTVEEEVEETAAKPGTQQNQRR